MLLYIFAMLPTIQLFVFHRKLAEANFIRRYHLVMFVLTLLCVVFQVLVHSVSRAVQYTAACEEHAAAQQQHGHHKGGHAARGTPVASPSTKSANLKDSLQLPPSVRERIRSLSSSSVVS